MILVRLTKHVDVALMMQEFVEVSDKCVVAIIKGYWEFNVRFGNYWSGSSWLDSSI